MFVIRFDLVSFSWMVYRHSMKQFWMVLSVMATLIFVSAQVQVGIQIERDQFLLYEPIPVQLTVLNNTGSLLKISGDWLSFLVTEQNGSGIRRDNKLKVDPLELESGSRKKITINITPLYSIRDIGAYHIQGIIEIDGVQYETVGKSCSYKNCYDVVFKL